MSPKNNNSLPKVIVLVGPTASGKTDWSLKLAKKYNGEIIYADSRQVYKKMDIGTAKPDGSWEWKANWKGLRRSFYVDGVIHHLVDFLDPGKRFTVAEFRDKAIKYIKLAYKNGRTPIVIGGTGLYVSALVDNFTIPRVTPNRKLRNSLKEKTNEQLLQLLNSLDPDAAKKIDPHNTRRIIRALEVCIMTGEPFSKQKEKGEPMFQFLQLGIDTPREVLYDRINDRVDAMMQKGLEDEIKVLLKQKYSWQLPSMSGIGYRQFKAYFEDKKPLEACVKELKRDTRRYARKQLSWFRRDKRIEWCQEFEEADKKVGEFLEV